MADVSDLLRGWSEGRGVQTDVDTVSGLVELLGGPGRGGGTRGAVEALFGPPPHGLSRQERETWVDTRMRLVQRRMVYESGGTTRQARPGRTSKVEAREITPKAIREAAARANLTQGLLARAIRRNGLTIDRVQATMGRSNRWEPGRVVEAVYIPPSSMLLRHFAEALGGATSQADWTEAAELLNEAWADAYGAELLQWGPEYSGGAHIPQVDELVVRIGTTGGGDG